LKAILTILIGTNTGGKNPLPDVVSTLEDRGIILYSIGMTGMTNELQQTSSRPEYYQETTISRLPSLATFYIDAIREGKPDSGFIR